MKALKGTGIALITPFKSDTSIDFSALGKLVEHVIKGGANFIVGLGTTGEPATMTSNEKQAIISYLAEVWEVIALKKSLTILENMILQA